MDAFVVRTAAAIDQLVADDFDDEQRVAERIEELASRPNTAAPQRPCTASVPSRTAQQPTVLARPANITTGDSETEESFYARIIQTARQQQQQQPVEHQQEAKRISLSTRRRGSGSHNAARLRADGAPVDVKRESAADVYAVPSRTHSPPVTDSRPSTSSSSSASASRLSFASVSSTSATPRSQCSDSAVDGGHRARPTGSVSFASLSALDRGSWHVERSQVRSVDAAAERPFSRRTSVRSRFPAIGK